MHKHDPTVIIDDDLYRVVIHEKPSLLYVLWKRHVEGEDLRDRYLALLGIISKFRPVSWLGNARAMHYTTLQDARWIFERFIPSLIVSSVSRYARLEAPQSLLILDSLNMQEKLKKIPVDEVGVFEFRFFTDEEMAISWLTSRNY